MLALLFVRGRLLLLSAAIPSATAPAASAPATPATWLLVAFRCAAIRLGILRFNRFSGIIRLDRFHGFFYLCARFVRVFHGVRLGGFFDIEALAFALLVPRMIAPALLLRATTALVALIAPVARRLLMSPPRIVHQVARQHPELLQINRPIARIEQLELHLVEA